MRTESDGQRVGRTKGVFPMAPLNPSTTALVAKVLVALRRRADNMGVAEKRCVGRQQAVAFY